MSSQFSYDLDERQVRMLMQDAEAECNEALWNKFDALVSVESKSSIDIGNYVPKFNLSISRSIVVPVMFIVLIGGLSAMLFSFVDFKKKEAIEKEIPLVANPGNFKKPDVVTAKVIKPVAVKATSITTTSISITTPSVTTNNTPSLTPAIAEIKKAEPIKVLESKPKEEVLVSKIEVKNDNSTTPIKKKKKRKITTEELPTIKAITNLNEGVSEPELDLK